MDILDFQNDNIDIISKLINNNYFDTLFAFEGYYHKINDQVLNLILTKMLQLSLDDIEKISLFDNIFRFLPVKTHNFFLENEQYDKALYYIENMSEIDFNEKEINAIQKSFYYASNLFVKFKIAIIKNKKIRSIYFGMDTFYIDVILDAIYHNENLMYLYDDDLFNELKAHFIHKYNLDARHLNVLENKFGPLITRYLDIKQIHIIINLDSKRFSKFIDLFPRTKYEMKDLEAIYDSFKQEKFSKDNPDIINIFANISHSLQAKDNIYIGLILKLKTVFSDRLIKMIVKKYKDQEGIIENDDYIKDLILKLTTTSGSEYEKYLDIIHIMCNYYIATKREEYRKSYDMINDLNLAYKFDEKEVKKEMIKDLLFNSEFLKLVEQKLKEKIKCEYGQSIQTISALKEFLTDIDDFYRVFAEDVINYYKGITSERYDEKYIKELQKSIKYLVQVGLECMEAYKEGDYHYKYVLDNCYVNVTGNGNNLKKKYYIRESYMCMYEILSNIRIDMIENILLDEKYMEEYNLLKKIIAKYKLDKLPPEVGTLIKDETFELDCNLDDLSTFISFFHDVYQTEKSKLQAQNRSCDNMTITIMNIFKYIDKYSQVSSIYSQILGNEDAGLIREDPSPNNSSGISKEDRLKKAIEKTFSNFKRQTVKVPTFISNVKTTSDKKLTAIVGNFTKPTNLTHGERTGACMRIGGAGYTLFDSNEIFHIELNDPITGKYISRVTGFRNGNTVFLNELRNSCDKDAYSDLDVVQACTNVAQELIERSKNSTCPIVNVVIHRAYAMEAIMDNRIQLNVSNIKQGLQHFYTDIGSYVHVLATTNPPFVPVNLDNSKVPDYLPVRERVRSGNDKLIIEQINRVHTINSALKGEDYMYINPITNIVYGIVGEDFYVYIDENLDIKSEMMTRDERCKFEYFKALEEINNYMPNKEMGYAV